jgi:hypothetical protein
MAVDGSGHRSPPVLYAREQSWAGPDGAILHAPFLPEYGELDEIRLMAFAVYGTGNYTAQVLSLDPGLHGAMVESVATAKSDKRHPRALAHRLFSQPIAIQKWKFYTIQIVLKKGSTTIGAKASFEICR